MIEPKVLNPLVLVKSENKEDHSSDVTVFDCALVQASADNSQAENEHTSEKIL